MRGTVEARTACVRTISGSNYKRQGPAPPERAGKKARTKALKVGMVCDFRYFGIKDLAKNITCK